jgi:hypothetical protein
MHSYFSFLTTSRCGTVRTMFDWLVKSNLLIIINAPIKLFDLHFYKKNEKKKDFFPYLFILKHYQTAIRIFPFIYIK